MRALVYLGVRTLFNGVKRALTSGRRLISILFVIGYYYFFFVFRMGSESSSIAAGRFPVPALEVLEAFIFAFFAVMTLFLALGASVQRMSFRPADVDVLFATPLSPRLVLLFRLARDYTATLLMPLLLAVLTWRPTTSFLNDLFRELPGSAAYVGRAFTIAWLLMSLAWVSVGCAAGLLVNRNDLSSDRNRKILTYGGGVLFISLVGYVGLRMSHIVEPLPGFVALTQDIVLRVAFFTGTFATAFVMAPMRGEWGLLVWGGGALLAIAVGGVWASFSQVRYLYDQAAARGFDSMRVRSMHMKGDLMGMLAEQARHGKMGKRRARWLGRIRAKGPFALLWKEVVVQLRAMPMLLLLFTGMGVVFGVLPLLASESAGRGVGMLFLGMQAMSTFMATIGLAQGGFIEVLRRVDLIKPLPFSPSVATFFEVAAKSIPATFAVAVASMVSIIVTPSIWAYSVAALIAMPLLSLLFSSAIFLVTVLFPDVEDPTQRGFRGMMILLSLVILGAPVFGAAALPLVLMSQMAFAPIASALLGGAVALGLSTVVSMVAGSQYARYNPSE